MTKDEKLLLEMYKGLSPENHLVNPFKIGKKLGYSDHQIKTILNGLLQANLIKRFEPMDFGLTERGKEIAKTLN
jgi:Mn-dependent DtxR family transcriptional regulator